jgi:hypothetical protein
MQSAGGIKPMSDPVSRSTTTTRGQALGLIATAQQIFIAYSHHDLRRAKELLRRITRIRSNKSVDSVFIDQNSISPGDSINADRIDQRLRSSDLVLILCGKYTASSESLKREISIALEENRKRGMKILPVILNPGIKLPVGIDNSIQGIFLTNLFPSILIARWAIGAIVTALILFVLFFSAQWMRAEIDLFLKNDELSRDPANLERRKQLTDTLRSASLIRYRHQEISGLLAKTIPETAVSNVLTNNNIVALCVSRDGKLLFAGLEDRLDAYQAADFKHVYSLQLKQFTVIERDTSVAHDKGTADKQNTQSSTTTRACGKLTRLMQDPVTNGILVEISYPGFARGDPCDSESNGESELLRLDGSSMPESLGNTHSLEWHNVTNQFGETVGGYFRENTDAVRTVDQLVWSHLPTSRIFSALKSDTNEWPRFEFIALDSSGSGAALVVRTDTQVESGDDPNAVTYRKTLLVIAPDGEIRPTSYRSQSELIVLPDGTEIRELEPSVQPAALHSPTSKAIVNDQYVNIVSTTALSKPHGKDDDFIAGEPKPIQLPTDSASNMLFSADGSSLILQYSDQSVAILDLTSRRIVCKFLTPPRTKQMTVSCLANVIYVLRDDGSVLAWNLAVFGPDGWAKRTSP